MFSSSLVRIMGSVDWTQSIFFARVKDFPYMKGLTSSMYLDYWGQTKAYKALQNQHSKWQWYQRPGIVHVCHHWHRPSWVFPKEINKQISSNEFNEMTRIVGGELKKNTIVWKLPS